MRRYSLIKIKMRTVPLFILVIVLISGIGISVVAAENDAYKGPCIEFNGEQIPVTEITGADIIGVVENQNGISSAKFPEWNVRDLFGIATKEMAPGLVKSVAIRIENTSIDTFVSFRFIAEVRKGKQAEEIQHLLNKKYKRNADNLLKADDGLLDHVNLKIAYHECIIKDGAEAPSQTEKNLVYNDTLAEIGSIFPIDKSNAEKKLESAEISKLAPKEKGYVIMTIAIDDTLTNENMNTICAVEFQFQAEWRKPWIDDDRGGGSYKKLANEVEEVQAIEEPVEEDITDVETGGVPKVEEPEEGPDIITTLIPGLNLPQTGGIRTFIFPIVMVIVVLIMLFVLLKKKKHDKKEREAAE